MTILISLAHLPPSPILTILIPDISPTYFFAIQDYLHQQLSQTLILYSRDDLHSVPLFRAPWKMPAMIVVFGYYGVLTRCGWEEN